MTRPVPVKLPPGFVWQEADGSEGPRFVAMQLDGKPILRIVPKRAGWLVVIDLNDPSLPQADVAVHSIAAGMRWSARWANGRAKRLYAMSGVDGETPSID